MGSRLFQWLAAPVKLSARCCDERRRFDLLRQEVTAPLARS